MKIHFEIGHIKEVINDIHETESVFSSDSLKECIKEWKIKKYTTDKYFIDVWETEKTGLSYPIADIKIADWIF